MERALTGTTNSSQSRPESNGNEGVRHITQSLKAGASHSDNLVSKLGHSFKKRGLTPLQRCSRCIL